MNIWSGSYSWTTGSTCQALPRVTTQYRAEPDHEFNVSGNSNFFNRLDERSVSFRLCRITCSYCPVVQRLTKVLGFLYCVYWTVINLSGGASPINWGWGYGMVSGLPKIILSIKVGKVVITAANERSAKYIFSRCLFLLKRIGADCPACTSIVLMVGE